MLVSTKGRYALRFMVDVASGGEEFTTLKDVSCRQQISLKYLEGIACSLAKSGLLIGKNGKGGGYKLAKSPDKITVYDVLYAVEGKVSSVACLKDDVNTCERRGVCKTLPMWQRLNGVLVDFFKGETLAGLIGKK